MLSLAKKARVYLFLLLALFSVNGASCPQCSVTVFYVPLDNEYYVPLAIDNILSRKEKLYNTSLPKTCGVIAAVGYSDHKKKVKLESVRLRTVIISENTGELFIVTPERRILLNNYIYDIDERLVGEAISEIEVAIAVRFGDYNSGKPKNPAPLMLPTGSTNHLL